MPQNSARFAGADFTTHKPFKSSLLRIGTTAVPHTLRESSQPVGAAKTQVSEPVSQYASALEDIAGPPVAPDPAAKYGPALGPLTGDAPASGTGTGVLGAVTAAAGSVVQTVKQVSLQK